MVTVIAPSINKSPGNVTPALVPVNVWLFVVNFHVAVPVIVTVFSKILPFLNSTIHVSDRLKVQAVIYRIPF